MGYIYETVIYDGGMKQWRILNLSTLTFYNMKYDTKEEAEEAIEHDTIRAGSTVRRVRQSEIISGLDQMLFNED